MWQKNKQIDQTCPGLLIPDTVIYRLGKPFFWYFTDLHGEIMRKGKNRVNHKTILDEFQLTDKEIIGSYLGFRSVKNPKVSTATQEYFTRSSFNDFIQNPEKCKSGILQKWIQPKSNHNSLIKVQWSSQFCLIERRTNIYRLDDQKVEFYEKLVTYEGIEHNSSFEPVTASWAISELQQICMNMSSHITAVSGGNVSITRMVLFFKHDENDRLWLMYCSALKVMDLNDEDFDHPLEWEELEVTIPKQLLMEKLPQSTKGADLKRNRKLCVGCNYLIRDSMMYDISLSLVAKFFAFSVNLPQQGESVRDNRHEDRELNDKLADKVPKVIRRLNKTITNAKYREMVQDPAWEHMQIKVCQDCFLHFTQVYANPEFFKEAPVLVTPPKITLRDNSPQSEVEPKKALNTPSRITYPNVVQNIKELEHRSKKYKTEPVSTKSADTTKKSNSRLLKTKSELKVESKEILKQAKQDLPSLPSLPPLQPKLKLKENTLKRIHSSKQVEKNDLIKPETQDHLIKLYHPASSFLNPIKLKSGAYAKKSAPSSTSNSRASRTTINSGDFIQDTLALLKSTISSLPH